MNEESSFIGGARNSDPVTSHDAAAQDFSGIAMLVHEKIKDAGAGGATWSELEISTGIARQTISPRFAQLRKAGLIRDSGLRRKAGTTGRFQIVWVATTPEEAKTKEDLRTSRKRRLFVWTDHEPDYSSGLAFAVAKSEQEAKELVIRSKGFTIEHKEDLNHFIERTNWGDLTVYPLSVKNIAFAVSGGS